MRRTKIVCTLGPVVDEPAMLRQLIEAGMDVARLNFSHGSHADHERRLNAVRSIASDQGRCVAVLQDLCGPKIRIGNVAPGTVLCRGDQLRLTGNDVIGNCDIVSLPIPELIDAVQPGDCLLLDDGVLELLVEDKTSDGLTTRVLIGGPLGSKKGISAPGVRLNIDAVTEKDAVDVAFGLKHGVDYVALSFVRSPNDVRLLRQIMKDVAGKTVPIIVKIEKFEAVEDLPAVLAVADGAMVARGDLGVELPVEEVGRVQKKIIRLCNGLGKPVITATQMLDSMIRNPRPTRAEVTDIYNAVLDGTDALMLSGETAAGQYPIEAVRTMARIAERAEADMEYTRILDDRYRQHDCKNVTDTIGEAVASIAHEMRASAIVCSTSTGGTARVVSKYRPQAPILAATTRHQSYRAMALYWGVFPMLVPIPRDTDEMILHAVTAATDLKRVSNGDLVVITAGTPIGVPGSTNLIKVHTIGQPLKPPARIVDSEQAQDVVD